MKTGLKEHARDLSLLRRAGAAGLMPPSEDELVQLATDHLLQAQPGAESESHTLPTKARLTYLRWKPHVSTTAAYTLSLEDGSEALLVAKRYADGKAEWLGQREERRAADVAQPGWKARAVLADQGLVLRAFPSDRELIGHQTLLDHRRLARVVQDAKLVPERSVRRRRTRTELLRYKPERRSVWRVELSLRDAGPEALVLAARVLPVKHAALVQGMRMSGGVIDRAGVGPRILATVVHTGLLLEEWLDVDDLGPSALEHTREVGLLVARLHTGTPSPSGSARRETDRLALRGLFAAAPALWAQAESIGVPALQQNAWVHGDLHPDQVVLSRDGSGLRLLDFDNAGPGDRTRELAGWVVDALQLNPDRDFESVSTELVAGYLEGGGTAPSFDQLAAHAADLCVHAAGACLRRLEVDAVEKAEQLLALGQGLLVGQGR